MTQDKDNVTELFEENMGRVFAGFMKFPFDPAALLEIQMKNFQAAVDAQLQAMESAQSITAHQARLAAQAVADAAEAMQELAEASPLCGMSESCAELLRKNYEKSVKNWQEFAEMLGKSNKAVAETINGRVTESISELKSAANRNAGESRKPAHKKAA